MTDESAGFGALLRACRVAAGLSQEDLARRSGLDVRTIRNLERGRARWPHPNTVRRLADALDLRGTARDEFTGAAERRLRGAGAADQETATAGSLASRPSGGDRPVIPRELPGAVRDFVGRAGEMAVLSGLLGHADQAAPGTVMISAIGGTAGVGKTALAVQWAHQVRARFPDGQLYVNLRGYDPDQPVPAADALAVLLRSLGVSGHDIPMEADERAARYRSLLAGRRMLIILDNARDTGQVRPLLPGSAGCVTVVTSRDSLAGLVVRDGARRLDLDLLPPAEAISLLRGLIGPRAHDDPDAAAELAAQCCRLPLALRVAAELAAAHPDVPLAGLVAELADQQQRLDLLGADGDPWSAVRAVFSWSHRHLDSGAARAFGLAGLHPGSDLDPYVAAALTGMTLEQARAVLDALARAYLIWPTGPGRFGLHDLLRAYARELAARDGERQQEAALTRLFDYYLHTASVAMDILHPAERHRRPRIPVPDTPTPPVAEPAAARNWLDAERATLVTVTAYTAAHGWPAHATRMSATLARYFDEGGHYPEAVTTHTHARAAAQRTGDRAAEAIALSYLAGVHYRQSRYQQAANLQQQALALFRQAGDRGWEGKALANLGMICYFQGRYQKSMRLQRQALAICREAGDLPGEALALTIVGLSQERQGRYDLAACQHRRALAIAAEIGAPDLECDILVNLGTVSLRQGRYREAVGHLHRALAVGSSRVDLQACKLEYSIVSPK